MRRECVSEPKGTGRPKDEDVGHMPPRESEEHLERRRAMLDVLARHGARPWPWWAKVRAHLESSEDTVTDLAKRAALPRRSLHRWLYEVPDEDMYDRAPPGEIAIVVRLADALDLPPYALMHPAVPWPVPDGVTRFGRAVRELIDQTALMGAQRRAAVLDTAFAGFAETAELVTRTIAESEGRRESLRRRVREALGIVPASGDVEQG